jgi:adenylate cyclase
LTRGLLRAGDRDLPLRPKSFEVLRYLVENPDRLLSKEELMQAIWPNVAVTDDSLKQCISEVRTVLGDINQQIIRTMPRRGYVFAAPVAAQTSSRVSPASTSPFAGFIIPEVESGPSGSDVRNGRIARSGLIWLPILAGMTALVLLVTAAWWRKSAELPLPDRPSVAVLPFVNMAGDPRQEYFSDGVSEDIGTGLGKFADLFVIARNSAFKYKGDSLDLRQIGRELGVRYLVQGSVRRDAGELRITAKLIDVTTGKQLWAERYDREQNELFAVQDDITQKIVSTLVAHITKIELDRVLRQPPQSLTAHDYYLRANALMKNMHRENRGETIAAARELYERSLVANAHYAPAVQGLAHTYVTAWLEPTSYEPIAREYQNSSTLDRAHFLAQTAVELDGNLAEAHATLGFVLRWQYRIHESNAAFERAFALNPNLADGRYGNMLNHQGRAAEAVGFLKRIMRLDPFHPAIYFQYLGNSHYLIGDYETAYHLIKAGAQRMAGYRPVFVWLAAAAAQAGRTEDARRAAAEVMSLQPDFTIGSWLKFLRLTKQTDSDHLAEGLRKAGLPE